MAYRVNWSPRATEDVESIATYISHDSEAYAASVVRKILLKSRSIANFPHAGRIVPEFGDNSIREIFAYSYRIIYRIEDEVITIAAVIHGKRLLEMELKP